MRSSGEIFTITQINLHKRDFIYLLIALRLILIIGFEGCILSLFYASSPSKASSSRKASHFLLFESSYRKNTTTAYRKNLKPPDGLSRYSNN